LTSLRQLPACVTVRWISGLLVYNACTFEPSSKGETK